MTGIALIAWKFICKHWQGLAAVGLVAALVFLIVGLHSRALIAEGKAAKAQGTVELMQAREVGFRAALTKCTDGNEQWRKAYEELAQSSRQLATDREEYERRLAEALRIASEAAEPQPSLEYVLKAESCEAAIDELTEALGWAS